MHLRSFLIALLLTILLLPVQAKPAGKAPEKKYGDDIEKRYQDCMAKAGSTTASTSACQDKAYGEWDKELNKQYNALMAKLEPSDKAAVRKAQQDWLKFRNSEDDAANKIYSVQLDGTMYVPMLGEHRVRVVEHRARELENLSRIVGIAVGDQ